MHCTSSASLAMSLKDVIWQFLIYKIRTTFLGKLFVDNKYRFGNRFLNES